MRFGNEALHERLFRENAKTDKQNANDHKFHGNIGLSLSFQAEIFTAYKHTCMPIDFSINCYFLCLLLNFNDKSLS